MQQKSFHTILKEKINSSLNLNEQNSVSASEKYELRNNLNKYDINTLRVLNSLDSRRFHNTSRINQNYKKNNDLNKNNDVFKVLPNLEKETNTKPKIEKRIQAEPISRKKNPPHKLNSNQSRAFEYFVAHKSQLEADFTVNELKTAFKALCIKKHPDSNPCQGAHEAFIELKKHYDCLKTLFN